MAKEELIEMNGVVEEVLPDSRFRVLLENGHQLVAYTAGKMRKHHPDPGRRQGDDGVVALRPVEGPHHLPPYRGPRP